MRSVDWEAQWAAHSPGYKDGYLHVDLKNYSNHSSVLRLLPGPGFGDLSHPTTTLVLRLMKHLVQGKDVLDIGCGSGILSLVAAAMHAKSVSGVDIEIEALEHSKLNAKLNGMEAIQFTLPENFSLKKGPLIVLMNMIQSEQCVAWESLKKIHDKVSTAVVSGILAKDKAAYLQLTQQWGWKLVEELIEGEWAGFVFST